MLYYFFYSEVKMKVIEEKVLHNNGAKSNLLKKKNMILAFAITILIVAGIGTAVGLSWFMSRYKTSDKMQVKLKEFTNQEYPANTSSLSRNHKRYTQRNLTVIKKDNNHFDFILEPTNEKTAKILIKNVDISLFVPQIPEWIKGDRGLTGIYLTEREYSRQQVSFPADSELIEIIGGDGFEKQNLSSIAIANNCLNAGYWEIILSAKENGTKSTYYQGWFTFPMGYYKSIFEQLNNVSYWAHRWRLEHWQDPAGTVPKLDLLRKVLNKREIATDFPLDERIMVSGEQVRKIRTFQGDNIVTWGDIYKNYDEIRFATFRGPGWYDNNTPWKNEYWRIGEFKKAILRMVEPTNSTQNLQEIEFVFNDIKTGKENKMLVSGIDLNQLPKLSVSDYPKGLYMPLGISVPPFYQSYEKLTSQPPSESPYFGLMLDSKDRWINHHELAIDGFVMHLDKNHPNLLHTYLLSYERHSLVAHFISDLEQ